MKTIILADDNDIVTEVLSGFLESQGYRVLPVNDGLKALKTLEQEKDASLLICDIVMPNMEGLETIKTIRSKNQDLKIIAITGKIFSNSFDTLEAAKIFGADATLKKPFENEDLLKAVKNLID